MTPTYTNVRIRAGIVNLYKGSDKGRSNYPGEKPSSEWASIPYLRQGISNPSLSWTENHLCHVNGTHQHANGLQTTLRGLLIRYISRIKIQAPASVYGMRDRPNPLLGFAEPVTSSLLPVHGKFRVCLITYVCMITETLVHVLHYPILINLRVSNLINGNWTCGTGSIYIIRRTIKAEFAS